MTTTMMPTTRIVQTRIVQTTMESVNEHDHDGPVKIEYEQEQRRVDGRLTLSNERGTEE